MRTLITFSLILLSIGTALGQVVSTNTNSWLHYMGNFSFTPKVGASLETSYRSNHTTDNFQQFFIRPAFDYKIKPSLTTSVGYTFVKTGVYGEPSLNKISMPENHVWVQANFQNKVGKVNLTNRFRNENRFVKLANLVGDQYIINDQTYRNRMRYMVLASTPIIQVNNSQIINGFIGNEIFLNVGKNAGKTLVNQNRVIAGLGYRFNANHQVQMAYILQNIWNTPNTIREDNNTLRLSYVSNLKISKGKKTVFTPNDKVISHIF